MTVVVVAMPSILRQDDIMIRLCREIVVVVKVRNRIVRGTDNVVAVIFTGIDNIREEMFNQWFLHFIDAFFGIVSYR